MISELTRKIQKLVIGERQLINTSFGDKPLIYADYTASGRSLTFIEDYKEHYHLTLSAEAERLHWFVLPQEILPFSQKEQSR